MSVPAAASDPAGVDELLYDFTGDLVFDVGGNVGRTARIFADRFECVISLEPCEESFAALSGLGLGNVEALPMAVSEHRGAVTLDVQEHPIKSGQLTTGGHDGWGRVIGSRTVPCTTLDDLAGVYGVPDLVKIDVEAHELLVVRGGLELLREHTPDLYIEVHGAELGRGIVDLIGDAYGDRLREIRHPHYWPHQWGYDNHFWLVAS